jgi:hypothetical protein
MGHPAGPGLARLGPGPIRPGPMWHDKLVGLGWAARRAEARHEGKLVVPGRADEHDGPCRPASPTEAERRPAASMEVRRRAGGCSSSARETGAAGGRGERPQQRAAEGAREAGAVASEGESLRGHAEGRTTEAVRGGGERAAGGRSIGRSGGRWRGEAAAACSGGRAGGRRGGQLRGEVVRKAGLPEQWEAEGKGPREAEAAAGGGERVHAGGGERSRRSWRGQGRVRARTAAAGRKENGEFELRFLI